MLRVLLLALLSSLALAAPLEGFGDATDAEIAEIRAGTYLEMFDENPTYNYNYKVADDVEQTYLSLEESRNDNVVTGMYSYVDPLGSLITVKYSAGAMGYTEERTEQPGFVQISARPVSTSSSSSTGSSGLVSGGAGFSSSGLSSSSLSSGSSSLSSGSSSLSSGSSSSLSSGSSSSLSSGSSSSSLDQSALISQILAQIQPLISQTVSTAIAGQSSSSLSSESSSSSSSSLSSGQSSSSSLSSGDDSLLILSPTSSTSSSSDLVAQILAQISPLVAQTVSSVVGNNGPTARSEPVQVVQVRSRSRPAVAAASQVQALAPAQPEGLAVFGSGEGNNVKINHAGANVEY